VRGGVAFFLSLAIYCLVAFVFTGSILAPIVWPGRAGPAGNAALVLAAVASLVVVSWQKKVSGAGKLPLFVFAWMILTVIPLGIYEDWVRTRALAALAADAAVDHSFFRSMWNSPEEFQFYLHSAALRNCIPYAWSYGSSEYYKLEPNIAVNVIPQEWIRMCNIVRTR
jgi:hypothetical protein